MSTWGWSQNSLVTVKTEEKTYRYTPEYYVLKHASHFVKSGARVLELGGDWEDSLGFLNPDGRVVLLLGNQNEDEKAISIRVSGKSLAVNLPASSVNTIVL